MTALDGLLGRSESLQGLAPEQLAVMAGLARETSFASGERILREGAAAEEVHVILTGKVALEIADPRGQPHLIETIGPGQLLGLSWLLPPYRWMLDATAVEPTTAITIDAGSLRRRCDDDPVLGYELFKRFAAVARDRLQHTRLQLLDLYGHDV